MGGARSCSNSKRRQQRQSGEPRGRRRRKAWWRGGREQALEHTRGMAMGLVNPRAHARARRVAKNGMVGARGGTKSGLLRCLHGRGRFYARHVSAPLLCSASRILPPMPYPTTMYVLCSVVSCFLSTEGEITELATE
jgi:hypothetical protein